MPNAPEPRDRPTLTTSEHAGLTVRTVGPPAGEPVEACAILCHGFGAPGGDLVGLAGGLFAAAPALAGRVRLHFPAAPLDLGPLGMPGGRAWWMLDMARLNLPPDRRVAALRHERPDGLDALRTQFDSLTDSLLSPDGFSKQSLVVGGFSQGSMLAADYALRSRDELGGLAVLSGALVSAAEWEAWADECPTRRVFQSHGTRDDILPFESGAALRDLLTGAGHDVRFEQFPGGHAIPPAATAGVAGLLERIVEEES